MPVPFAKLKIYQEDDASQEFLLDYNLFTIGCEPDNTLCLAEPDVSRYHAQVVWEADHYAIADLGSATGTYVNNTKLSPRSPEPLVEGDLIRIGNFELQFQQVATQPKSTETASPLPGTLVLGTPSDRVLQVTTPQWTQEFPLKQDLLILGRDPQCDIVIDLPVVSWQHAQLQRCNGSYEITDLGTKNGLLFAGEYVSHKVLNDGDVLYIGDDLTLTYQVILQTEAIERIESLNLRDLTRLTLGRDPSNDTVIDHPVVSRFHAQIELQSGSWVISDLNSSNGTFVNGKQISSNRPLRPGDTIRIGPYHFIFNFDETLVQQNEAGNLRLDALHLTKTAGKDITLLNDISLSILPREFVAIVGVSGAGKSTLLDALNGFRPATSGTVLVNENDLYKNFNAYRTELGYVPQDDIIHRELAVAQALDYAAQLRLPADTTPAERHQQVQEVLEELELTQRRNVLVKNLSGGQRKRVSMGVELLTKPSLFFLDEATSGLDPGTEAQMMRLLRKLADQGRTVLLITHATKNVMMCNMVVFLAKGGCVAYFGPPDEALIYFGVKDFDEIYLRVEGELSPEQWQERYQQSPQYQRYITERQRSLATKVTTGRHQRSPQAQLGSKVKGISSWRQFLILSQRNLTILIQDRASLILMLALAPILGLLDFVMWRRNIFDVTTGSANQALTMLFVAVLVAVMVGSLATMREIVKEAEIYRRERMIGLKIGPYILSKVWVSVLLAIYQAAIFLLTKELSVDIPGGLDVVSGMYITLLLATLGGMIMGLLVSALSSTQNIAPLLTILFLVPQITFAGSILPLNSLGVTGQVISQLTITRWAYESMITLTGIGRDIAEDSCWQKTKEERDNLSEAAKKNCKCLGPNLFKSCNFPGIKNEYDPAVDQPEPPRPKEPGDPFSQGYQDQAKNYSKAIDEWQNKFSNWKEKRGRAIASGEALMSRFQENQGGAFKVNVPGHWAKLALIMAGMLGLLFFVQKRKDLI